MKGRYREALIARYPDERGSITRYLKALHAAAGWLTTQMSSQMLPAPIAALFVWRAVATNRWPCRQRRAISIGISAIRG